MEIVITCVSADQRGNILPRGSNEMSFKAKYVGLFHNKPYYTKMHIN